MQNLLAEIDDSFFDAVPSPDKPRKRVQSPKIHLSPAKCLLRTPKKQRNCRVTTPKTTRPPVHNKVPEAEDFSVLLDDAENWDWDDMLADFMTPKRARKTKVGR